MGKDFLKPEAPIMRKMLVPSSPGFVPSLSESKLGPNTVAKLDGIPSARLPSHTGPRFLGFSGLATTRVSLADHDSVVPRRMGFCWRLQRTLVFACICGYSGVPSGAGFLWHHLGI